ncbi:MAG: hypothetical protein ACTSWY_10970 [Promethearchaeota archaeon]
MVEFVDVVKDLRVNYPSALAVAIIDGTSNIVYTTANWDVSGDIKKVMAAWRGGSARFIKIQGVKYSILQVTGVRLVGTNFGKQGHIVGAATSDQSYYMLAYISPDAEGWHHVAYPSIARAVSMLEGGSSISEASKIVVEPGTTATSGTTLDPLLKGDIDGFLQWIKDSQGLAGYISYYLQQNDTNIISKLAAIYNEFRRIFNF